MFQMHHLYILYIQLNFSTCLINFSTCLIVMRSQIITVSFRQQPLAGLVFKYLGHEVSLTTVLSIIMMRRYPRVFGRGHPKNDVEILISRKPCLTSYPPHCLIPRSTQIPGLYTTREASSDRSSIRVDIR